MADENKVFITDATRTVQTPDQLLGKVLEVEKPRPPGSTADPEFWQLPAGVLLQAVNTYLAGPNNRRDGIKIVRHFSSTRPDFPAGDTALDLLDPNLLCLNAEARVEFGEDGTYQNAEYVLRYDATGPLSVWVDGSFSSRGRVPARWFRKDTPAAQQAGVETFNPNTARYPAGSKVIYDARFWTNANELVRTAQQGQVMPAPGDNAGNAWTEISRAPQTILFERVGRPLLLSLVSEEELRPQRTYEIVRPGGNVLVLAVGDTGRELHPWGVWRNPESGLEVVGYDLGTDEITPISVGGGESGPAVVPFAAGQALKKGQIVTDAGGWYEVVQDIANPQVPPSEQQSQQYYIRRDYTAAQAVAAVSVSPLAARLLPATSGVLAWYDGQPLGVYASLGAASDAVPLGGSAAALFQVYGAVGNAQTSLYVRQPATVEVMAGAVLTGSTWILQYANEQDVSQRVIRLVGEGELVCPLDNFAFDRGLRLEVEVAKWRGNLTHKCQGSFARPQYFFKNVRITLPAGKRGFDLQYQFGAFYKTSAFVWLDGCIVEGAGDDIFVARGTLADGGGANPADADSGNLVRLTHTTVYPNGGQLLNQTQGGAALEQDATGGGGGGGADSYTNEQAQDAVAAMIAAGTHTGISFVYDDAGNRLNVTVTATAGTGGGVDFANPVTLAGSTTLSADKAYYVTGSGYTLTLPSAASNLGKAIFVSIATNATGLYPLSGAGTLRLWAGESINLRATQDGWKNTGGDLLPMSVRLETTTAQQDSFPANNNFSTIPLSVEAKRSGVASLADVAANRIVVPRNAIAQAAGVVVVRNCRFGGVYYAAIKAYPPGGGSQNLGAIYMPVADNGFAVGQVSAPAGQLEAGTALRLELYLGSDAAALLGQAQDNVCSLSFTEIKPL